MDNANETENEQTTLDTRSYVQQVKLQPSLIFASHVMALLAVHVPWSSVPGAAVL